MSRGPQERVMMISTHGYVSACPEFGKPDTGGQVAYVLELVEVPCPDGLSRRHSHPPLRGSGSRRESLRTSAISCDSPAADESSFAKETLCDSIAEWVTNVSRFVRAKRRRYTLIDSHYWDAGLAGQALANRFGIPHVHTPHSIGAWKRDNMDGDPAELERRYNFRRRIREEKVVYDECDVLLATTPPQRDILAQSEYDVPLAKIRVIPPGYDDTRFFPVSLATRQTLKRELDLAGRIVLALGPHGQEQGLRPAVAGNASRLRTRRRRAAAAGGRIDRALGGRAAAGRHS